MPQPPPPRRVSPLPSSSPASRIVSSLLVTSTFQDLGVGAAIWSRGSWQAIHLVPGIGEFEAQFGKESTRWSYNDRCLAKAQATRRTVRGEHQGFFDLFVPIESKAPVVSVLVAGPFAIKPPTAAEVTSRWRALTHQGPSLGDPAFYRYLSQTLATLTLPGSLSSAFTRWMESLAHLMSGTGAQAMWAKRADALTKFLWSARAAERMWEAAQNMVDDRTSHLWSTPIKRDPLRDLGMDRPADDAMAALLQGRSVGRDPVEEVVRRSAFQRAAAELAWDRSNVVCGRIGDRGISLLLAPPRRAPRAWQLDLVARLSDLARRFGLRLFAGVGSPTSGQTLSGRLGEALAVAERSLARGQAIGFAESRPEPSPRSLAQLRIRLAQSLEGRSQVLVPRFERYAEGVVFHTRYELGATRAHLEAGLDRLVEPLLASGQLDAKSFEEMHASIERHGADTVSALIDAYRSVVSDIEIAIQSPTQARQDRSTRRALRFMREHLSDPLTLPQVSRVAGFAPGYFSRLLQREVGATFDRHLQKLRLERAKQALAGTTLSVERVAQLAGFRSRTYFQQLFRQSAGCTPIEYRRRETPS
jgi:AraC-like DNA-binding protein